MFLIKVRYNICYCEETLTIPPEILKSIKETLIENLTKWTNQPDFRDKYCTSSPLFTIAYLYIEKNSYIRNFVESLPLNEIIINHRAEGAEKISEYILNLFYEDLTSKKDAFSARILYICQSLFTFQIIKALILLELDIQTLIAYFESHPNGTENIPIYTDGALTAGEELMRRANDAKLLHITNGLSKTGFEIHVEEGFKVSFRLIVQYKPYLFPEVKCSIELHPIFKDSKIYFQFCQEGMPPLSCFQSSLALNTRFTL